MKIIFKITILFIAFNFSFYAISQKDSANAKHDTLANRVLIDYKKKLKEIEQLRITDSIKRVDLETKLKALKNTEDFDKKELIMQIEEINAREAKRIEQKKARIDSLKITAKGNPVLGILNDTLFYVYAKIASVLPRDRANAISKRMKKLFEDELLNIDSISIVKTEYTVDIVYGEALLMSIFESDALWNDKSTVELAAEYCDIIKKDFRIAREESKMSVLILKIAKIIGVITLVCLFIWIIGILYKRLLKAASEKKDKWLKSLAYKEYTFLSAEQELKALLFIFNIIRWLLIIIVLYMALPVVFSILVFTRRWADILLNLIWTPFKGILISIWEYLPNLFSIIAIYFVMKYFIRFIKYIFSEIKSGNLKINGFYADWAMPTYSMVRFLLYAFTFVLIFPYLPGSESNIFKGVSVFIGVIFSFGSSSAVANIVAGLVITYMRPFKTGDQIKIGEITGDVVEKTLLVTRLKTIKNEEITIPNSTILTGNISNYSSYAKTEGLILNTTVTIGYGIPWKDMHQTLIDAALRTDKIVKEPKPFVLQTSLDDFYVSYQINAYTKDANDQFDIYSQLHQNIQDVCNERGIEIMSPHYRNHRDGNMTTIPADYLADDYKSPNFNININKDFEE